MISQLVYDVLNIAICNQKPSKGLDWITPRQPANLYYERYAT